MWVHPPLRKAPNERDSATSEYMTVRREGVKAGSEDVDIVLGYPVRVTGRVVLAQSGKPVAKYRVLMYPAREEEMAGFLRYFPHTLDVEDSEGRFELMARQEGPTKVFAQGEGTDIGFAEVEIVAGRSVEPVEIKVADGLRVEGSVLSSTGQPVEGARIYPYGDPGALLFDSNRYACLSDAQGRFALDGIGEGPFYVEAVDQKLGKGSTTIHVHPGVTPSATIRLTGFGTVEGRITSNGKPVAGAIVTAGSDPLGEPTSSDGRYHISGVRGGTVTLAVKGLDRFRAGYPSSVTRSVLVAARSKATADFELHSGTSTIAGKIVGDVAPPSRVLIHAFAASGEDRIQYRVDHNGEGHFEINNVAAGTVSIEASISRDNYRSESRTVQVSMTDNEQIEQNIVFESETTLRCDVADIADTDGVQVHLCPGTFEHGLVTPREVFGLRVASGTSAGDQPILFSGIKPGPYTAVVFNHDAEEVSIGHLTVAEVRPGELNQVAFTAP